MADIDRTGDKFSTWLRYEKELLVDRGSNNLNEHACAGREQLDACVPGTAAAATGAADAAARG